METDENSGGERAGKELGPVVDGECLWDKQLYPSSTEMRKALKPVGSTDTWSRSVSEATKHAGMGRITSLRSELSLQTDVKLNLLLINMDGARKAPSDLGLSHDCCSE